MKTAALTAGLFLLLGTSVHAQPTPRQYPVPGHGTLELTVPEGWSSVVQRSDSGMPPTIELTNDESGAKLLVTPLWSPIGDVQFNAPDAIRAGIARAAKSAQSSAVEKELVLRSIETSSGPGSFFWATDRAPKKGEFRYMANGAVPVGKLLLSFTILSHAEPPDGIDRALKIVGSATHQQ